MNATTMPMSPSSAVRKTAPSMSLHVALLAQQQSRRDEALQTEVMVYRQPGSDVPVPAAWRPSQPAALEPLEPLDTGKPDDAVDEHYGEDIVGWESAGVSIHRLEQFEQRYSQPRRIAAKGRFATPVRLSILLLGSVLTCSLIGWVTLL